MRKCPNPAYDLYCPYALTEDSPVPCFGTQEQCDAYRQGKENGGGKLKCAFVICTVRKASTEYKKRLEEYVAQLEADGISVHLPHRDTDQEAKGIDICKQNRAAIEVADEVHIFYNPESTGTHFDLGMSFAMGKTVKVIESVEYGEGKSFPRMLVEWEEESK